MPLESHGRFCTKSPGSSSLSRPRSGSELLEPGPGGGGGPSPKGKGRVRPVGVRQRTAADSSTALRLPLWGSVPHSLARGGGHLTSGRDLPCAALSRLGK